MNTMKIKDAIETLQAATADCTTGDRHLVVLDRGWIFAGNLSLNDDGTYTLTNAIVVTKWTSGGFGGLTLSAKESGATLDPCAQPIKFHRRAMVFAIPIPEVWGQE